MQETATTHLSAKEKIVTLQPLYRCSILAFRKRTLRYSSRRADHRPLFSTSRKYEDRSASMSEHMGPATATRWREVLSVLESRKLEEEPRSPLVEELLSPSLENPPHPPNENSTPRRIRAMA
jgi:hypothetical protein